jgi:hypothetical protein
MMPGRLPVRIQPPSIKDHVNFFVSFACFVG